MLWFPALSGLRGAAANMLGQGHQALPPPCFIDSDDALREFQNLSQLFYPF